MNRIASLILLALAAHPGSASATQPALDPRFGDDGIASVTVAANDQAADAVVLLRDGFTYLHIGQTSAGLVVTRQHARGALDTTWDRDGRSALASDGWTLTPTAAAMQTQRRLLVAGYATSLSDGRVVPLLCRFLSYGAPDPAMQSGDGAPRGCRLGMPSTHDGALRDEAAVALLVLPEDRIAVATRAGEGETAALHVNRLDADGVPDAVYGPADDPLFARAFTTLPPRADLRFDAALPVAGLAHDGRRILLAGTAGVPDDESTAAHHDIFVAAFDAEGRLADDFGDAATPGLARVALGPAQSSASHPGAGSLPTNDDAAIAFRRNGEGLMIAGTTTSADGDLQPVVVRLHGDGTRDAGYGTFGVASLPEGSDAGWDGISDAIVDPSGRVILVGSTVSTLDGLQIGLARLTPDGTPDTTFGEAGTVHFDFTRSVDASGSADWVSSLSLSWPGSVMVGGQAEDAPGDFRLVRLRWY